MTCCCSFIAALILAYLVSPSTESGQDEEQDALIERIEFEKEKEKGILESYIQDAQHLPSSFWVLCCICIFLYGVSLIINITRQSFHSTVLHLIFYNQNGFPMTPQLQAV